VSDTSVSASVGTAPASDPGTVASAIADALVEAGIERCFGIPGGGTSALLVAFERVGIRFVLTHGETSAAVMAAADAERTGVPGVVLTSGGPGAAAVVDGVAHAWLDRVPLLVVTDRLPARADRPGVHQWLDHRLLFAAVTKGSVTLSPAGPRATIEHALAAATSGVPGPVHVDLPSGVARTSASVEDAAPWPSVSPVAGGTSLPGQATELLRAARRPLLLVGLGSRSLPPGLLDDVADRLRAPVLTTYKGKGAIDERSPWSAGLLTGGAPERDWLDAADLVVSVGLDGVELFTTFAAPDAPWIALDAYDPPPSVLPAPSYRHLGDIASALRSLPDGGASRWSSQEVVASRQALDERLGACEGRAAGVHPWRLAVVLSEVLSSSADLTVDAGAHMLPLAQAWRTRAPGSFLISNGLATMGFGLPAGIARSSAHPDRHVVCCTGDGGLLMVAGELATAAREARHLTIVVFDDRSLSLIRSKQSDDELGHGVELGGVDWVAVAEGFGLAATRVDDESALRRALEESAHRSGPSLISVTTDPAPYPSLLSILRGTS
jgi:acetolactate synthase I/II/III large subunit